MLDTKKSEENEMKEVEKQIEYYKMKNSDKKYIELSTNVFPNSRET